MACSNVKPCAVRTRSGAACRQSGMKPSGRCKLHGGRTLRGLNSASLRHGRYSKALPPNLQDRFEEALANRELLSHRKDAALIDSIITQKLAELRDEETNPDLETIASLVGNMSQNLLTWDWTKTRSELDRLQVAITKQQRQDEALRDVRALSREKTVVVAHENR